MRLRCLICTFLLLYILIFCSWGSVQSEEGHVTVEVFSKGLDFIKDLLIEKAENSLVPMELPKIEKTVKIPLIGKVRMEASNITLFKVHITSSTVKTGDEGIVIDVSGATANLTTNWMYSYSTWLVHFSDEGEALIQVEGMEIGLTLLLKNEEGSLKLSVLGCGCNVKDLSIIVNGGASWLYQGFVDAFEGTITSRIQNAISKKVREGAESLNSVLGSLPKEVAINSLAALNVTFIGDPALSDSSLAVAINGLLSTNNRILVTKPSPHYSEGQVSCNNPSKMVSILVHESVLESASLTYYAADKMHWIVYKVPDQSLLNTAGWKSVVPQLYKQYPDDDMNLNISAYSPPIMKIVKHEIDVTVPLDVIINVLNAGEVIPVLCISVEISGAASPEVSTNSLAGSLRLDEFTMSLRWSNIGDLHMDLVASVISTLVKTVVVPYINLKLNQGFPLPIFHGYKLQNAQIGYNGSWIVLCGDAAPFNSVRPYKLVPLNMPPGLFLEGSSVTKAPYFDSSQKMETILRGLGQTNVKMITRSSNQDTQIVGFAASMINFVRTSCVSRTLKKKREEKTHRRPTAEYPAVQPVTLEDWMLGSPAGMITGSPGEFHVFKQSSTLVHQSFKTNHEFCNAGFPEKGYKLIDMLDKFATEIEVTSGGNEVSYLPSRRVSLSNQVKKRVTFWTPVVADVFPLDSPQVRS